MNCYITLFTSEILLSYAILKGYREMQCVFAGTLLDHLTDIFSPDSCQIACEHYTGCEYFSYDYKHSNLNCGRLGLENVTLSEEHPQR